MAHARELERQKAVDARRPTETRGVYSTPRWKKERARFLHHHPLCPCGEQARYVDHVKPWRSFPEDQRDAAFWDVRNWQPLCHSCHSRKTAAHDGGFGNRRH